MIARHDRACTTFRAAAAATQSNVDLETYKYNTRAR